MANTWGRQYRFLFFFTLVAGLILPLVVTLNVIYLENVWKSNSSDISIGTLIIYCIYFYIVSEASNIAGLILMIRRYELKKCFLPLIYTFAGLLSLWLNETYETYGHGSEEAFVMVGFFVLVFVFMLALLLLGRLFRRKCRRKVTYEILMLLSTAVLILIFYSCLYWMLSDVMNNNFVNMAPLAFQGGLKVAGYGLAIMSAATVALLLTFRFKIPTDELPQQPQEGNPEEQHDAFINDR